MRRTGWARTAVESCSSAGSCGAGPTRHGTIGHVMWFFGLIVVLLIGAVAVVASGRWGGMAPAYDDRPDVSVPGPASAHRGRLETARFGVGLRGYRMDEVDTLLERVAREVAERDRRIADLERAVTPILHGPEGAGFTSRSEYAAADFDDTGFQQPIMVGGDFPDPPRRTPRPSPARPPADPQPADEPEQADAAASRAPAGRRAAGSADTAPPPEPEPARRGARRRSPCSAAPPPAVPPSPSRTCRAMPKLSRLTRCTAAAAERSRLPARSSAAEQDPHGTTVEPERGRCLRRSRGSSRRPQPAAPPPPPLSEPSTALGGRAVSDRVARRRRLRPTQLRPDDRAAPTALPLLVAARVNGEEVGGRFRGGPDQVRTPRAGTARCLTTTPSGSCSVPESRPHGRRPTSRPVTRRRRSTFRSTRRPPGTR